MSTPILSRHFFEQYHPDTGFFSKWRSSGPWSEKCLPVYEWEGVLFVACLYPPDQFPKLSVKSVFVLCDPESLKNVWYEYQGTVVAAPVSAKPAPLSSDESPEDLAAFTTKTPVAAEDRPEGLSIDLAKSSSAPEDLSMDSLAATLDSMPSAVCEENILADVASEEINIPEESPGNEETDFLQVDPFADVPMAPASKPTAPSAASAASEEKHFPEVTRISVNALQATPKNSLDSFMQNIFNEMSHHYNKSMVFLKDGTEMKPWRWDGNFQMNTDEDASQPHGVTLSTPSPWRIVMKTQKPYHGFITPNEINEKFFEAWNQGQTPEHLTLVPVMIEDHVIGILLGLGEKAADNKTSLQLAEKLARDISQQIRSQPEFLKASAQ